MTEEYFADTWQRKHNKYLKENKSDLVFGSFFLADSLGKKKQHNSKGSPDPICSAIRSGVSLRGGAGIFPFYSGPYHPLYFEICLGMIRKT